MLSPYHIHSLSPNQCSSSRFQTIDAPLPLVWSMVRRFDHPQSYKKFVKSSTMQSGDGGVGSIREVEIISGMPARFSVERLDMLDDENHVMMFSIIGGDHKLENYQSTTTLHEDDSREDGSRKTLVMESYIVDVPAGSSEEDTCLFADTIVRCNLQSLANISKKMALDCSTK